MKRHNIRTICSVCAGQAEGFGYSPPFKADAETIWACSNKECRAIARETYLMTEERFNRIEIMAVQAGGGVAGQFLENLGKTDLATMTPEEWGQFCRTLVNGYRSALRDSLGDEAPF